jgi:hypothetical protein
MHESWDMYVVMDCCVHEYFMSMYGRLVNNARVPLKFQYLAMALEWFRTLEYQD